jgi:alkylation response protein AidB-like acyl-CoA dehydrogenase
VRVVIELDYDDVDGAFAESVGRLCEARLDQTPGSTRRWSEAWWRDVGELGVLGLATPEGGGTVTTIAAVMEAMGRANAPGPLVETFVGVQLLDEQRAHPVVSGDDVVTVTTGELVPWLPVAATVIVIDAEGAHLGRVAGDIEPVDSLAGDPWGRAQIERTQHLGDPTAALAVGHVAAAAYMVGEAEHLLHGAASYAADRIQFRTPIGSFQGVAHPLADCHLRLTAARTLTRIAAHSIDTDVVDAAATAAMARRSATKAALKTAFQAHQTYGAIGFTVEGPVGNRSTMIRQTSLAGHCPERALDQIVRSHSTVIKEHP